MMIECPRCGFTQPKDQFCASCGLNIENFRSRPKSFWVKLAESSNLHLTLIGALIVAISVFLVYSQRKFVSEKVGQLLDLPLSSRDAADPEASEERISSRSRMSPPQAADSGADVQANDDTSGHSDGGGEGASEDDRKSAPVGAEQSPIKLTASQKLEVQHWEVPRETLQTLLPTGQKVGEGSEGKLYLFANGTKVLEQIQGSGQRLSAVRAVPTAAGGQLSMETPPTTTEAFQYALFVQVQKVEGKELGMKLESHLVLPQAETPAEAASQNPTFKTVTEATLVASPTLKSTEILALIMEPAHRAPRDEYLARAGDGPWNIFSSAEYRASFTDWVVLIHIR